MARDSRVYLHTQSGLWNPPPVGGLGPSERQPAGWCGPAYSLPSLVTMALGSLQRTRGSSCGGVGGQGSHCGFVVRVDQFRLPGRLCHPGRSSGRNPNWGLHLFAGRRQCSPGHCYLGISDREKRPPRCVLSLDYRARYSLSITPGCPSVHAIHRRTRTIHQHPSLELNSLR